MDPSESHFQGSSSNPDSTSYWEKPKFNPYEFKTSYVKRDSTLHQERFETKPGTGIEVVNSYHPTDHFLNMRLKSLSTKPDGKPGLEEEKARETLAKRRLEQKALEDEEIPGTPKVELKGYSNRRGMAKPNVSYKTTENGSPIHGYGAPRPQTRTRSAANPEEMPGTFPRVQRVPVSSNVALESSIINGFNVLKDQVSAWLPELPKVEEPPARGRYIVHAPMSRMTKKRLEIARKERPAEDELERRQKVASAIQKRMEEKRLEALRQQALKEEALRQEELRQEALREEELRQAALKEEALKEAAALAEAASNSTPESFTSADHAKSSPRTSHESSKIKVPVLDPVKEAESSSFFSFFRVPSFLKSQVPETTQPQLPPVVVLPKSKIEIPDVDDQEEVDFPFHLFNGGNQQDYLIPKSPSNDAHEQRASQPTRKPTTSALAQNNIRSTKAEKHKSSSSNSNEDAKKLVTEKKKVPVFSKFFHMFKSSKVSRKPKSKTRSIKKPILDENPEPEAPVQKSKPDFIQKSNSVRKSKPAQKSKPPQKSKSPAQKSENPKPKSENPKQSPAESFRKSSSFMSLSKLSKLKSSLIPPASFKSKSATPSVKKACNSPEKFTNVNSDHRWHSFSSMRISVKRLADKVRQSSKKSKVPETASTAIAATSSEGPPAARFSSVGISSSSDNLSASCVSDFVISQPGVSETELSQADGSCTQKVKKSPVKPRQNSDHITEANSAFPVGVDESKNRCSKVPAKFGIPLSRQSSNNSLRSSLDSIQASVLSGSLWKSLKTKSKVSWGSEGLRVFSSGSNESAAEVSTNISGLLSSLTKCAPVWRAEGKVKFCIKNSAGEEQGSELNEDKSESDIVEPQATDSAKGHCLKGILKASVPVGDDILTIEDIDLNQVFSKAASDLEHFEASNQVTMMKLREARKGHRDIHRKNSLLQMQTFTSGQDELITECEEKFHEYFSNFDKIQHYLHLLVANLKGCAEGFSETCEDIDRLETMPEMAKKIEEKLLQHYETSEKFSIMTKSAYLGLRKMEDGLTTRVSEILSQYESAVKHKVSCHEQYRALFKRQNKGLEVTEDFIDKKLGCLPTVQQVKFINRCKQIDLRQISYDKLECLKKEYSDFRENKDLMERAIGATSKEYLSRKRELQAH